MTQKRVLAILFGFVVVGSAVVMATPKKQVGAPAEKPPLQATGGTPTTGSVYTLAEVSNHQTGASCWSVVNGSVYDLTSWIASHPGGEGAILGMCGTDASNAFNQQHSGQSRPERFLESFKIGVLK